MGKLAPSILSADFSRLGEQVVEITNAGADYIHIDVMDGHFVPNISFGATVMKSLNRIRSCPYDVHLMIENPDNYIEEFVTEKTEYIVVHQEATKHLNRTIQHIKALGIKAGIAINPATPVSTLECILADMDLVLVMSVNPGFGGQRLIENTLEKVELLKSLRKEKKYDYQIEMDGGINLENIEKVIESGVDIIVVGSAVFGCEDISRRVKEFKKKL